MTHAPLLLILDALAVYRLSVLVSRDLILEPVRRWLVGSIPSSERMLDGTRVLVARRPLVAEFLSCPWCVSFWLAIGVVLMQALVPSVWFPCSCALAFSAVAGVIAEHT